MTGSTVKQTQDPIAAAAEDPRIAQTKARVVEATAELLVQRGFANTSIEGVAAASGVAKSTIYRHWSSRESLCIDAYRSVVQPQERIRLPTVPSPRAAISKGNVLAADQCVSHVVEIGGCVRGVHRLIN